MNHHYFQTDFLSRRALAFAGIAAFHVLIAYLLLTALVQAPAGTADTPLIGFVTPTVQPPPVALPPDFRPTERNGPIAVPPTPQLAPPQDPSAIAAIAAVPPAGGSAVAVPTAPQVRMIGTNQIPNTEDYYPPDMRRLGIQGATNVRVCVDPQGRLLGEPTVEDSSGNAPLDIGALNAARHGRFARSMQGDVPVGNCFRFRIAFRMLKPSP